MYKTILNEVKSEIVIEKSRFIAHILPVTTEEDAKAYIEKIKKEHWQARHNVPCYVLGEKYEVQRYSDDGEPSGTAGVPVLEMIKKEGITNVCIVITRYFGGIKLGTGGLVRAYTQAVKSAFEKAGLANVSDYRYFQCSFDYTYHGKISHLLSGYETYITETLYTDQVVLSFYTLTEEADEILNHVIDLTSNSITLLKDEIVFGCIISGEFKKMEESS
ncbi:MULTISPECIES: YigZ family protein [unclassified Fusibacter]|uniref:YigZ family protein n=1 Tax=unclassified Fusibacter TaxID=2624464 RepID=UPI001013AD4F|nr:MULTISPECIES: YigZ family protein [unclassified Fusibacter]MCK8061272.1 YigZ family protein [Fusibacter sp. A2]NPE23530.1 YigZ family protein [Fusibacter sp. A1]RXV59134.1 YigZ family protein [Fusibacter sp. A1]